MNYTKITPPIIEQLKQIVGQDFVFTTPDKLEHYGRDETENLLFMPEVVVKPNTPQQIADILKIANTHVIPVTPRAAGTGLSGGALPIKGGIILSVERFNKILALDERNLQATVEPGVINEVFQNAVAQKGLFYPPDPASKGSCFMGGNIAENSGGPKCVKYGVTRDYLHGC
ncbi:MAG: FAD-binding oxidoreductase [Bacteroidia bacterium]